MSVSADYSRPVAVNGYLCWNCHQVAEAKKGVNPDGPSATGNPNASASTPAVLFGGVLTGSPVAGAAAGTQPQAPTIGQALDITA
jgi:hypothetical protein